MALIDAAYMRDAFQIHPDIKDGLLLARIGVASRRLKGWVGADVYEDAEGNTPQDVGRKADLQLAEAHLAMHFALLGLNTQLRPTGVVKSERAEGEVLVSYLTPREISDLSTQFLETAEEMVRGYILSDGTPGALLVGGVS